MTLKKGSIYSPFLQEIMMINKEVIPYLLTFSILGLLFNALKKYKIFRVLRNITILLFIFYCYFFRDPDRKIIKDKNKLLSPADGKILFIKKLNDGRTLIRIFMSPLDVHINRSPCDGKIKKIIYKPGKFLPAYKKEASKENEYNLIIIKNNNIVVPIRQISGILARNIVCWKKEGDYVKQGDKIGMIKLGSGTEITVPNNFKICVKKGDYVQAGIDIIAEKIN